MIADKIQFSVEMCFDNQVKWQLGRVKIRSGRRECMCMLGLEIRQGQGSEE